MTDLRSARVAVCAAVLVASSISVQTGELANHGTAASRANNAPRLSALTAKIGPVHEEGGGIREGGVRGTYRVCDDGPQTTSRRPSLIRITHRAGESLLVREQYPTPTWDVYFDKPECVSAIPWSSTIPADLRELRELSCYSVSLRVRDPAGRWSNGATRAITRCRGG